MDDKNITPAVKLPGGPPQICNDPHVKAQQLGHCHQTQSFPPVKMFPYGKSQGNDFHNQRKNFKKVHSIVPFHKGGGPI